MIYIDYEKHHPYNPACACVPNPRTATMTRIAPIHPSLPSPVKPPISFKGAQLLTKNNQRPR